MGPVTPAGSLGASGGPLLVPLSCPRCGGELDGGSGARVFLCRTCAVATFEADPAEVYPLRYVAAAAGLGRPDLFAPFWRVAGQFAWQTGDRQKQRVYERLAPLGPLLFPAFWSPKAAYYDDLTLRYARRPELLTLGSGKDPVLDGMRAPKALGELARLAWLAYLDRFADITGTEGTFEIKELIYAAVPFFRRGDHFEDGILGCSVPTSFFSMIPR